MTAQSVDSLDGALLIDKPVGYTSHDVVDAIRDTFPIKKVGHCGTLDPNATGLLILVLGRGTKLSEKLMAEDKTYSGTAKFGEVTDSYDVDGEIVASHPVPTLTPEVLNEHAAAFIGDQMQVPPMVSATKQSGKPLYKLARKGIEVERKAKLIHVYHFAFTSYEAPYGYLTITCTKGTYVRSLVHELGRQVGCGAHLASLRRIESGRFAVDQALPLKEVLSLSFEQLRHRVIPIYDLANG